ncbi:MAG: glucose-6-phosphate dehydrogenase, partial [Gammaproteobacteria bacterium]|nr:glucose-6-phosphate dehydrogenase [Gammaproteobacteria bacterium]
MIWSDSVFTATSENPLLAGTNTANDPQPCILVIFGGGGDLTRRKLLPALYNQALEGDLPANFAVIGLALEDMDDVAYRDFAREGIQKYSRQPLDKAYWTDFEKRLHYLKGSFDDEDIYAKLKQRLDEID